MENEYLTSTMDYPRAIRTVAHRGAMALAPENSLLAFTKAAELGIDSIETDVRLSADGLPAIIHDPTLTRTHGHKAHVGTMTMAELQRLGVPSLSTMLDSFAVDFDVIIDLKEKSARLAESVGRAVAVSGRAARCFVTGSDLNLLRRAQSLAEGLRLSWTIGARHGTLTPAAVVEAAVAGVSELAVEASGGERGVGGAGQDRWALMCGHTGSSRRRPRASSSRLAALRSRWMIRDGRWSPCCFRCPRSLQRRSFPSPARLTFSRDAYTGIDGNG